MKRTWEDPFGVLPFFFRILCVCILLFPFVCVWLRDCCWEIIHMQHVYNTKTMKCKGNKLMAVNPQRGPSKFVSSAGTFWIQRVRGRQTDVSPVVRGHEAVVLGGHLAGKSLLTVIWLAARHHHVVTWRQREIVFSVSKVSHIIILSTFTMYFFPKQIKWEQEKKEWSFNLRERERETSPSGHILLI